MFMLRQPLHPQSEAEQTVHQALSGSLLVVDVREPSELAETGKAKGALHIPLGRLREAADPRHRFHDHRLQRSVAIALYCGSGGRAGNARRMLQDMGFADVRLIGSFDDWINAGGTVVAT